MKRKLAMTAILVFTLAVSGVSQENIEENLISANFQGVPLGTVLKILSDRTDRKLITDAELSQRNIVLSLEDVTADEAINALLDTYDLYYIRQPETNIYVVKSRTERILTRVTQIFFLNYSDAADMPDVLSPQLNPGGEITYDPRTNAVLVTDLADNINKIGEIIERLDNPEPQVFIEARILETNITDALSVGADLAGIDLSYGDVDAEYSGHEFARNIEGMPSLDLGVLAGSTRLDALIDALQIKSDARMLNNPKILVLSNETATIDIFDELPYREFTETARGNILGSVNFKDVGVKIEVTPHVNKDGSINMNVIPSHSFQTGTMDNVPIIKTSEVDTSLRMNDGDTVVIGGLIRESESRTEEKVPLFGDIPVMGYLFKRSDQETLRNELTVFITAKIVGETFFEE